MLKTDLIIVSPISGDLEKEIENNMEFVQWIKTQRIENDSEIEFDRISQSEFIIFSGQKAHTDEPIKKAQLYIENNYEQKRKINEIAGIVNLNSRSFLRRFRLLPIPPLNMFNELKLKLLKRNWKPLQQPFSK